MRQKSSKGWYREC